MTKIFIDTNIFLDLLLNREGVQNTGVIIKGVKNSIFDGYIASITLLNIDYIANRQKADQTKTRQFLEFINTHFKIVDSSNIDFEKAVKIDNSDLEDNIQITLALKSECNVIVTNDVQFLKLNREFDNIEIVTSQIFIDKYIDN